jgi:hypothetical protein
MQRVSAILLLVFVSFSLIAPSVRPDAGSKLPPCCRKNGQHHCSMDPAVHDEQASATAIQSVSAKCPLFPNGGAAPASGVAGVPRPAVLFFAAIASHPTAHAQTEAQFRVSFSRTRQKRGPPTLLS